MNSLGQFINYLKWKNQICETVSVGIYGNKCAGKTTFLYHIFKKWKDNDQIVEGNNQFNELMSNYESDVENSGDVQRTVHDQFEIGVKIKKKDSSELQQFVFTDIRGENASLDLDLMMQGNVPVRLRKIAENCDVFLVMFNPSYLGGSSDNFYQKELQRMIRVIEILVLQRQESLPRICYVQTHDDVVKKRLALKDIAHHVKTEFVNKSTFLLNQELKIKKLHPNFFPLDQHCFSINSLGNNKDKSKSPLAVLDRVLELSRQRPLSSIWPLVSIISFIVMVIAIILYAVNVSSSKDPKWISELREGRFSPELLPDFKKYVSNHRQDDRCTKAWNDLYAWLKSNPDVRFDVLEIFQGEADDQVQINTILDEADLELLERMKKEMAACFSSEANRETLVSTIRRLMTTKWGEALSNKYSKNKSITQAKQMIKYLEANTVPVNVVILDYNSKRRIADKTWRFYLQFNKAAPCVFSDGQDVIQDINFGQEIKIYYQHVNESDKRFASTLKIIRNSIGLPDFIRSFALVSENGFNELIQMDLLSVPELLKESFFKGKVASPIPGAPILVNPPSLKPVEITDASICWEIGSWYWPWTKGSKKPIKLAHLGSGIYFSPRLIELDDPSNSFRPFLEIHAIKRPFNELQPIQVKGGFVYALFGPFDPELLNQFDMGNVARIISN